MSAFTSFSFGNGSLSRLWRRCFAGRTQLETDWPAPTAADTAVESTCEWIGEDGPRFRATRKLVQVEEQSHSLPKLAWKGGGDGPAIGVGIFAGLDAGALDTVQAALRVLEQLETRPALGFNYALSVYPKVNAPAFGEAARSFEEFQQRTEREEEEDGQFFRQEIGEGRFSMLIRLHSDGEARQFHAVVRGSLIARCVVAPALEIVTGGVPMAEESIVLKARRSALHLSGTEDCLAPGSRNSTLEVELHAPGGVEFEERVWALAEVTVGILAYYRSLLSLRAMV